VTTLHSAHSVRVFNSRARKRESSRFAQRVLLRETRIRLYLNETLQRHAAGAIGSLLSVSWKARGESPARDQCRSAWIRCGMGNSIILWTPGHACGIECASPRDADKDKDTERERESDNHLPANPRAINGASRADSIAVIKFMTDSDRTWRRSLSSMKRSRQLSPQLTDAPLQGGKMPARRDNKEQARSIR